jgi:hypothetical protein
MSKSMDIKKEGKKKATKSIKEKRLEKKLKKAAKAGIVIAMFVNVIEEGANEDSPLYV